MEKSLLRLLLKYQFYEDNKGNIPRSLFSDDIVNLYDILCTTHEKLKRDLSKDDLQALYFAHNPTLTQAKKEVIGQLLDTLPAELDEQVAKEVLKKAYITEAGRKISQIGIDIINGKHTNFAKAREIIEKIEQGSLSDGDDLEQVSDELELILEEVNTTTKWNYNIQALHEKNAGIGPGIFCGVMARVEVGKTGFAVSLCAAPGGFADQGALVHYYANEEKAARTKARAVMAFTGIPYLQLSTKLDEVRASYAPINEKLKFFECRDRTIQELEGHIKKHKPDVVIVDQLDKLSVYGSFAREDERLGELYIRFRNILAKYDCAGIGLSQANADAEGKAVLNTANMALARTSKPAELDVLFGIGKSSLHNENTRIINVLKNKVTGSHSEIICQLQPEISRYVS